MTYRIINNGQVLKEDKTRSSLDQVVHWLWQHLESKGFKASSYFLGDRGMVLASRPGKIGTVKFIVKEVR